MYTKKDLFDQLHAMGAPQNVPVLMHSALRLIGEVEGGASGLLDALIEYFTAEGGLLAIPTHTWSNLGRTDVYTLDLTKNESNLGAFARLALEDGRGVRSENPTHSVVVFGDREKAEAMIAGEIDLTTPTGEESFYGRLYRAGGYVLLAGVSQNRNTYLHAVDEMLSIPNRMGGEPYDVSVKRPSGEVLHRRLTLYHADFSPDVSLRFVNFDVAFRYLGCLKDGFLGDAPAQLCSAVGMYDAVKHIYEQCESDPLATENSVLPKVYAK